MYAQMELNFPQLPDSKLHTNISCCPIKYKKVRGLEWGRMCEGSERNFWRQKVEVQWEGIENRKLRGVKVSMTGGNVHSTSSRRMIWGCVQPSPLVSHPHWRSHSCWTWVLGPHNIPHGSDTWRGIWIGFTNLMLLDVHNFYMKKRNFFRDRDEMFYVPGHACLPNNISLHKCTMNTEMSKVIRLFWVTVPIQVMHEQLTGSPRVFSW